MGCPPPICGRGTRLSPLFADAKTISGKRVPTRSPCAPFPGETFTTKAGRGIPNLPQGPVVIRYPGSQYNTDIPSCFPQTSHVIYIGIECFCPPGPAQRNSPNRAVSQHGGTSPQKNAANHEKAACGVIFWHPRRESNSQLTLRSSPQFANRFVTKHKETQAFTGFWRVLFLTIPKGFTAKITSFSAADWQGISRGS